ncbi:MAG: hypothetical protein KJ915_13150 [Candidatus Omnitrophica bacterium]|nr:hypothetical protein [Candidatus Omnitrophota bacterium]
MIPKVSAWPQPFRTKFEQADLTSLVFRKSGIIIMIPKVSAWPQPFRTKFEQADLTSLVFRKSGSHLKEGCDVEYFLEKNAIYIRWVFNVVSIVGITGIC